MIRRCGECRYYQRSSGNYYRCRRYPPVPYYDGTYQAVFVEQPVVDEKCWCGEFEPKKT